MKINSDIQEIVDRKSKEYSGDAGAAVLEAWDAGHAGHAPGAFEAWRARNAWCACNVWRHYENQF